MMMLPLCLAAIQPVFSLMFAVLYSSRAKHRIFRDKNL